MYKIRKPNGELKKGEKIRLRKHRNAVIVHWHRRIPLVSYQLRIELDLRGPTETVFLMVGVNFGAKIRMTV